MKTYSAVELAEIIEKHHAWLSNEEVGVKADLRSADLRYADLRSADLRYANLSYADLSYADLRSADLRSADLRYADLSYADLRYADLSYADLSSIYSMQFAVGNMLEIKSIQCDIWPVTYTHDRIQIGCQTHSIDDWWGFSDAEIERMDSQATAWWSVWKPILKAIIDASPAVESVYVAPTLEK